MKELISEKFGRVRVSRGDVDYLSVDDVGRVLSMSIDGDEWADADALIDFLYDDIERRLEFVNWLVGCIRCRK